MKWSKNHITNDLITEKVTKNSELLKNGNIFDFPILNFELV